MAPLKPISELELKIGALKDEGLSQGAIARKLGLPKSRVEYSLVRLGKGYISFEEYTKRRTRRNKSAAPTPCERKPKRKAQPLSNTAFDERINEMRLRYATIMGISDELDLSERFVRFRLKELGIADPPGMKHRTTRMRCAARHVFDEEIREMRAQLMPVKEIAEKIGKKPAYIHDRIRALSLVYSPLQRAQFRAKNPSVPWKASWKGERPAKPPKQTEEARKTRKSAAQPKPISPFPIKKAEKVAVECAIERPALEPFNPEHDYSCDYREESGEKLVGRRWLYCVGSAASGAAYCPYHSWLIQRKVA